MKHGTHKTLFSITTAFFWFSLYAYIPELSTYAGELGASYRMIGLITGSYGLTQLILRIPLGTLSDRLGKRKGFVIIGLLTAVISCSITFIHPTAMSLLATRLLAGVSASSWVAFTVLFSSYYQKEEATKSIGIINGFNAVGQLTAMFLGGFISLFFGTRYLYLLGAIGGIAGLIFSLFVYENKDIERKPSGIADFLQVAKDSELLYVSVLAIFSQIITFATSFGFVPVLAKNLGAESIELSLLTMIGILPGVFMPAFTGAVLVKKWGAYPTLIVGFSLCTILCVLMPFTSALWILILIQFFSGLGRTMTFPLLMGLGIAHIEPQKRATAMGFFQAIYGIGMVFGPILLGYIAEKTDLIIGFMVTGITGVIAILFIVLRKPKKKIYN